MACMMSLQSPSIFLSTMEPCKPRLTVQLISCLKMGDWKKALEIYTDVKSKAGYELNIESYTLLMRVMAKAKQPRRADLLFKEMEARGFHPNQQAFCALIAAYARSGMLDKVDDMFTRMKRECTSKPDALVYDILIRAYIKAKLLNKLEILLLEVHALNVKLSFLTFNMLIDAYGKLDLCNKMEEVFEKMIAANYVPDQYTYNAMISVYGRTRQILKLEETAKAMQLSNSLSGVVSWSCLLHAYQKSGTNAQIDKTIDAMYKSGCELDRKAYTLLIDIYGKRRKYKLMQETYKKMVSDGFHPTYVAYTAMLNAYGKSGSYKDIEYVERQARMACELDVPFHLALLNAYSRIPSYSKMQQAFDELLGLNPESGEMRKAYNMIIEAYGSNRHFERMEDSFEEMQCRGIKPDVITYTALLNAYGKAGLIRKMDGTFVLMQVSGCQPNEHTFGVLLDGYGKLGFVAKSEQVLSETICAGLTPTITMFTSLLDAYRHAGLYEDMAIRFSILQERGFEPNAHTITVFLSALESCKHFDDANVLLQSIKSCERFSIVAKLLEDNVNDGMSWRCIGALLKNLVAEDDQLVTILCDGLVNVLWCFGWHKRAAQLLRLAHELGIMPNAEHEQENTLFLDLHMLSSNVADVTLVAWLSDLKSSSRIHDHINKQIVIITGQGKRSKVDGNSPLRQAMSTRLLEMGSPFCCEEKNPGRFVASGNDVHNWLLEESFQKYLSFPNAAFPGLRRLPKRRDLK